MALSDYREPRIDHTWPVAGWVDGKRHVLYSIWMDRSVMTLASA